MKVIGNTIRLFLVIGLLLLQIVFALDSTAGPPRYTYQELSVLPGFQYAVPRGINNLGQVVGSSSWSSFGWEFKYVSHAVLWHDGAVQDLGILPESALRNGGEYCEATATNDQGLIVGYCGVLNNDIKTVLWNNGPVQELGGLSGGFQCIPVDVNNLGQITGNCNEPAYPYNPWYWLWQNGNIQQVPMTGFINDLGQIAGSASPPGGCWQGATWQNGTLQYLGIFDGTGGASIYGCTNGSYAGYGTDINNLGQIVGESWYPPNQWHGFFWQNGMVQIQDLGTEYTAYKINNKGWILGGIWNVWATTLNIDGTWYNINDLIDNLPEGDFIPLVQMGRGIVFNDLGQVAGTTANGRPFLLTPRADAVVANAGTNQAQHVNSLVTLDGSGSFDPGGNVPLTYQWSVLSEPAGSSVTLSDTTIVNPTFTPLFLGDYVFQLVVTNSLGTASSPGTVTISTLNALPIAEAGMDQVITAIGTVVHLNGDQSYDPDGDQITYNWAFLTAPSGSISSISGSSTSTPTFIADVHGTYVVRLTVGDPWGPSNPDTVTVSFENVKPVANSGTSLSVPLGVIASLVGSGYDANGDPLTYSWSLTSKPANSAAAISSLTNEITSLIPDLPGTYVAQLVVNDGFVNSDPSTIQVLAYATESAAIQSATEIQASISSLPVAALKNANMKKTLGNKINATIASIDAGLYADALDQLKNDILGKMDGCAATGAPDKNDWITTCNEQNQVYPFVQETIWIVEGLLAP